MEFAIQLLVMHNENNRKQPGQTVVEDCTQKQRTEKVCRLTIKISSVDDFIFFQCLLESYKRSSQLTDVDDIRDQLLACVSFL